MGVLHVAHVTSDRRFGSTLAGYRLDEVLGRGGMGVVYRAEHLTLRRSVALKLVAPELATDARFRERFLAESRLAASLEHPNVIPIYDAGEADGQLYLAMRLVEGQSLRDLLAREAPLPPAGAIELLSPVASALDTAHARGLVHRDVKPANILLEPEGDGEHVYLSDFGLARLAGEARPDEMAHLSGSLHYLAPEQVAEQAVDPRADVYALGCVLHECLTGATPFRESSPMTLLWAHASEPPPRASERNPRLPKAIDPVVARALAKEPGDRYPSCGELIADAAKALGVRLTPRGISRRRLLGLAAGGALGVAAAAAVPAILLTRSGKENPAKPTTLITRDSIQRIDPETNELAATIPFGQPGLNAYSIGELAVGEGAVWVIDRKAQTVNRIDADTNTVSHSAAYWAPSPIGAAQARIEVGLGGVWVYSGGAVLARIDPRTGTTVDRVGIPGAPFVNFEGARHGAVWVWANDGLWRIDPETRKAVRVGGWNEDSFSLIPQPSVPAGERWWLRWWDEHVHVGELDVYDLASAELVASFDLPFSVGHAGVAEGNGSAWVSSALEDTVWQLDPSTGSERAIHVGKGPRGIAFGDGGVWVANSGDGTVSRIDPASAEVVATIAVGGIPISVAAGLGAVWLTVYPT
jgi:YVTN family beta-propeller protein